MDLGFHGAGFTTVLACEMNRDACETFRRNGLGPLHEGDVRDLIPGLRKGQAQVVFGGPPCQGISVAGKMDPLDPRSGLIDSFLDAVGAVEPAVFVMENVDALLSVGKWRPRLQSIRERAGDMGYGLYCTVLNAADYGVPQSRKRFFAIGAKGVADEDLAAILTASLDRLKADPVPASNVFDRLGPQGSARNPATSRAAITFSKNPVMRRTAYAGMLFNGAGRPIDPTRPAPTMTASAGGNKTHIIDEEQVFGSGASFCERYHDHLAAGNASGALELPQSLRRLTIKESAAFQGFPDDFSFAGKNSSVYRQIGNAVPVGLATAVAAAAVEVMSACGINEGLPSLAA
jgi:DNA (cytosine-5)-methyltransferase 1